MTNRMREQLWCYFPALLELESDLGAEWLLDLWETVPTPDKAARIREPTIAKLLKRHRIRRFDAPVCSIYCVGRRSKSRRERPNRPAPTSLRSLLASASSTGSSNKHIIGSIA